MLYPDSAETKRRRPILGSLGKDRELMDTTALNTLVAPRATSTATAGSTRAYEPLPLAYVT